METFMAKVSSTFTTATVWTVLVSTLPALLVGFVIWDYRAWIAFGTGGTPANLYGYLRITQFRVRRLLTFDDLRDASGLSDSGPSYLQAITLPRRKGQPPKIISRTLPQRQHPEPLDPEISRRLHEIPQAYVSKYPQLLILDKSITEGRSTDAIYARPNLPSRKQGAHDPTLGHEIAHVHHAENSLHVWLTEADCKKVVSSGWGERFPLASLNMVHAGWTFVYAPRTMQHVEVIEQIVEAGIQNVTGTKIVGSVE